MSEGTELIRKEAPVETLAGDCLVSAQGLTKVFGQHQRGGKTVAVDDVSFEIRRSETLGLVGESGSGKSTIARMLLGLEVPSVGELFVFGISMRTAKPRSLKLLRRKTQMVFQDPVSSLNPHRTVEQIIGAPLRSFGIGSNDDCARRVRVTLELVGLAEHYLRRLPRELSGGECQRVAIARALVIDPELLVLDEAVTSLDLSMRSQILNLLREVQSRLGLAYLFISHDLAVVRYMSDRICVMQHGSLVEMAEADALFKHPSHAYTQQLLAAVLEPPTFHQSLQGIKEIQ